MEEKDDIQLNQENEDSKEKWKRTDYVKVKNQFDNGLSWFFWIAGLSIINTIVYITGGDWNFIIGLGITQIIDEFVVEMQGTGMYIALLIDILVAGGFALLGFLGRKRRYWVFIVGIIIYTLDALIFLYVQDWVGLAFHVLAIYGFVRGMMAVRRLKEMDRVQ